MKKPIICVALLFLTCVKKADAQNNFDPTGNVGIGTSTPQQKLHVVGTSLLNGTTVISGSNKLHFWSATDGPWFSESYGIRANPYYNSHAFMIMSQPLFVGYEADGANLDSYDGSIMLSNRLGIGTKTPARKLSLNSTNNSTIADFGFFQGGVERGLIAAAGASNQMFTGVAAGDLAVKAATGKLHLGAASGTAAPGATILQNGYFGLSTVTPNENLTIKFPTGNSGGLAMRNINNDAMFSLNSDQSGNILMSAYQELVLSTNYNAIVFKPYNYERMRISHNGNIGIATNDPQHALDVNGNLRTTGFIFQSNAGAGKVLTSDANGNASWQAASGSSQWTTNSSNIHFAGGNVGIGTTDVGQYRLAVNGDALFTKIRVKQYSSWPDYVFHPTYKLRTLHELENYIHQFRHLPEVPSASDVLQNGIDVADTQATLLKKVEELTLYIIELNKRIESLEQSNVPAK